LDYEGEMKNLAGVETNEKKDGREHVDIPTYDDVHTSPNVMRGDTRSHIPLLTSSSPPSPTPAPATVQATPETAALLYQYGQWLKGEGYAISTITTRVKLLRILASRGADLHDPESVKAKIAEQQWCNKRKMNAVDAYTTLLRMKGGTWAPPRYTNVETLPFIPTEKEIDDLIAGCGPRTATFLLFLKETGARAGEATKVKWTDVDLEAATVRITPEKGSHARIFKLSLRLMAMINALKAGSRSSNVFNKSQGGIKRVFERQRKKLALKLQNPRLLMIHFHTFRHWKATTEYARTRDILHVMQLLGHKRIQNTLIYTQLTNFKDDEYATRAARSAEEAQPLIEGGFEYVCTTPEGAMLFRKRK
jgi:integrase